MSDTSTVIPTSDYSILTSIKKLLGIGEEYEVFDTDIVLHINSVFSTLQQLGVGPTTAFSINSKAEKWGQFIGTERNINEVVSYVYLRVRLLFDPPETSYAREAMEKRSKEMEWRMNVQVEGDV